MEKTIQSHPNGTFSPSGCSAPSSDPVTPSENQRLLSQITVPPETILLPVLWVIYPSQNNFVSSIYPIRFLPPTNNFALNWTQDEAETPRLVAELSRDQIVPQVEGASEEDN